MTNVPQVFSQEALRTENMNLGASFPLHMQIISDQLMNDSIFHSHETVITKGIET